MCSVPSFPTWNLKIIDNSEMASETGSGEDFVFENIPIGWEVHQFPYGFSLSEFEMALTVQCSHGQHGKAEILVTKPSIDGGMEVLARYAISSGEGWEEILSQQINDYMNGCHNISRMIWAKTISFEASRIGFEKMKKVFTDVSRSRTVLVKDKSPKAMPGILSGITEEDISPSSPFKTRFEGEFFGFEDEPNEE